MISITDGSVHLQTSSASLFATPARLGKVALVASHLQKQGILNKICEHVRFARRRFGHYEVLDFLAVQHLLKPLRSEANTCFIPALFSPTFSPGSR